MSTHVLMGPGGLTVAVWNEVNPSDTSKWGVMASAYDPSTAAWDGQMTEVTGWFEPPASSYYWLARPVMDPGGTVTTTWTAKYPPDPSKHAQYSATRAMSTGFWSTPTQISTAKDAGSGAAFGGPPWLAVGQNGTVVAAWEWENPAGTQAGIFANARDPFSTFGSEVQVSPTLVEPVRLVDLEVWPDGTAVALWIEFNSTRPSTSDVGLFWSARPPAGNWGGGGEGQLGAWSANVYGAALELGSDGTGTALWAVRDANLPANQDAIVLAAHWPAGGPWQPPRTLMDGHAGARLGHAGLAVRPGGRQVAATWVVDDVAASTYTWAVFYSEWQKGVYLPAVFRETG